MTDSDGKSEDEWRAQLTDAQFDVTRRKGTERPFTGEYLDCKDDGAYTCICCGAELFNTVCYRLLAAQHLNHTDDRTTQLGPERHRGDREQENC